MLARIFTEQKIWKRSHKNEKWTTSMARIFLLIFAEISRGTMLAYIIYFIFVCSKAQKVFSFTRIGVQWLETGNLKLILSSKGSCIMIYVELFVKYIWSKIVWWSDLHVSVEENKIGVMMSCLKKIVVLLYQ